MQWCETIASQCRYGEIAELVWEDWDILWEDSIYHYQGHVSFIAHKEGRYAYFKYSDGS